MGRREKLSSKKQFDENEKNPGPIINSLVSKELSNFRIPIMIVPGNFSSEHIALIT